MVVKNRLGTSFTFTKTVAVANNTTLLTTEARIPDGIIPILLLVLSNTIVNNQLPSQIIGMNVKRNGVKLPKTSPRVKAARLGKIMSGNRVEAGKNNTARNKSAFTNTPVGNCA